MLTREKIEHHISHLQDKHNKIDKDITELYNQHGNDMKIETLKKVKLHIKDEIEKCRRQIDGLNGNS
jgi:hypothetical protein